MTAAAVQIGHNLPPEPLPFIEAREHIDGLLTEARNWLDGAVIDDQAQADSVAKLMDMLRAAVKSADEARKAEAQPHDEAKAEIQARWNTLIGSTKSVTGSAVLALDCCRRVLAPWEKAQAEARAAEAARLRAEAAEAARNAALATQLASRTNLDERENAEAMAREAKALERDARKAEGATSATRSGGRAMALTGRDVATVTDALEFSEYLLRSHPDRFVAVMQAEAQALVNARVRGIPGVRIDTQETVR